MRMMSVFIKSLKEQIRSYWILILILSMAPFFVVIYYMINEATYPGYDILVVNNDEGLIFEGGSFNHGSFLIDIFQNAELDSIQIPLNLKIIEDRLSGEKLLKNKRADALVILPASFSKSIVDRAQNKSTKPVNYQLIGNLTDYNYLICAVWINEVIHEYVADISGLARPVQAEEEGIGMSARVDDFDLWIPGILILSIIMLMFSASIAIVTEIEHRTMLRLKMSRISTFELLSGISLVQILIGIIAIFLTLQVAIWLGFNYVGTIGPFILIAILTSISIIAFSLILASLTKSANEILVVGNFPLFLFMFFTGAAFPMKGKELFTIFGYEIGWQGLMSPTHAIQALNKLWIMNLRLVDIIPEIIALICITLIYFAAGLWIFWKRHMSFR